MGTRFDAPQVTYEWFIDEQEPITQMESGRRMTVIPRQVEICAGGFHAPGSLSVYLRGQRLNRDGSRGNVKAAVFSDEDRYYGELMEALPEWALPYVEQVRTWEAARW